MIVSASRSTSSVEFVKDIINVPFFTTHCPLCLLLPTLDKQLPSDNKDKLYGGFSFHDVKLPSEEPGNSAGLVQVPTHCWLNLVFWLLQPAINNPTIKIA